MLLLIIIKYFFQFVLSSDSKDQNFFNIVSFNIFWS